MPSGPTGRDRGDTRPATRTETRKAGNQLLPDELQDVKNALEGRKFLEKHLLLSPPGEPVTHGALSACLHQISAMAGIPKQAINAIRSTAFLLDEMEEDAVNETIREALDSQVTELTSDMKLLVEDAKEKIGQHVKESIESIKQALKTITPANAPAHSATETGTCGKKKQSLWFCGLQVLEKHGYVRDATYIT